MFGKKNPKFNTDTITTFSAKIGVPAMLFYSLAASKTLDFETFMKFGSFTFLFVACFAVIGIVILKILKRDIVLELSPLILPNTGNIGLPICLFAYGEQGFSVGSSVAAVIMLLHFTVGVFIANKKLTQISKERQKQSVNFYYKRVSCSTDLLHLVQIKI